MWHYITYVYLLVGDLLPHPLNENGLRLLCSLLCFHTEKNRARHRADSQHKLNSEKLKTWETDSPAAWKREKISMQITVVQKQKYSQSARGLQRKERYPWPRELGRLWAVSERMGRIWAGRVELRTAWAKAQSGKGIARSPVWLVCHGNAGNSVTRGWTLSRGLWMPSWGVGLDWPERRGDLLPVQSLTQTVAASCR